MIPMFEHRASVSSMLYSLNMSMVNLKFNFSLIYLWVVSINDFPLFLILFKQSHKVRRVFGSMPLEINFKLNTLHGWFDSKFNITMLARPIRSLPDCRPMRSPRTACACYPRSMWSTFCSHDHTNRAVQWATRMFYWSNNFGCRVVEHTWSLFPWLSFARSMDRIGDSNLVAVETI